MISPRNREHARHTLIARGLAGSDGDLADLFTVMGPDVFDLPIAGTGVAQ